MVRIISTLVLAAAALAAPCALAQQPAPDGAPADQTAGEIAAIDLLNRGQAELGREDEARRVASRARAQAEQDSWARAVEHANAEQAAYQEMLRQRDEAYRRELEAHAQLVSACRAGDRAACDASWLAQGLTPPPR